MFQTTQQANVIGSVKKSEKKNGKSTAKMLLLGMLHRREASSLAAPTEAHGKFCVHWKMMFENQVNK